LTPVQLRSPTRAPNRGRRHWRGGELLLAPLARFRRFGVAELISAPRRQQQVANNPRRRARRLWIASARDDEDGTVTVAVRAVPLRRRAQRRRWTLAEICHRNFDGGSVTPTLGQARASIATRSARSSRLTPKRGEVGAARRADLRLHRGGFGRRRASPRPRTAVVDEGDTAGAADRSADLYDSRRPTNYGVNLLLTASAPTGCHQSGAGHLGAQRYRCTGVAHIDRATGAARWFADGSRNRSARHRRDGALICRTRAARFCWHRPHRRAAGRRGQQMGLDARRSARDAACAPRPRRQRPVAQHVPESRSPCGARRVAPPDARCRGAPKTTPRSSRARRLLWLGARVGEPPVRLSSTPAVRYVTRVARYHRKAARGLRRACRLLTSATGG
jgi:hypothetical protein